MLFQSTNNKKHRFYGDCLYMLHPHTTHLTSKYKHEKQLCCCKCYFPTTDFPHRGVHARIVWNSSFLFTLSLIFLQFSPTILSRKRPKYFNTRASFLHTIYHAIDSTDVSLFSWDDGDHCCISHQLLENTSSGDNDKFGSCLCVGAVYH